MHNSPSEDVGLISRYSTPAPGRPDSFVGVLVVVGQRTLMAEE